MKTPIPILIGLLSILAVMGCATDKALDIAGAAATAIIEKSNFTETTASADGRVNNPKYRVWAVLVNGVMVEIAVDGVEVNGQLSARGQGEDKPLSPETIAAIRERLNDPGFVDKLGDAIARRAAPGGFRAPAPPDSAASPAASPDTVEIPRPLTDTP